MIVHESRNSTFRRPFGAAETGTEVYLAAEKAGAADMTLEEAFIAYIEEVQRKGGHA